MPLPKPLNKPTGVIMVQGTGSDVGKSLLVAGLCRVFANQGLNVRPFKPQNMSNNAAVTLEGGEIGRAQALQALAARTPPTLHMNPVLLKPETDLGAQVVVQGKVLTRAKARDYYALKSSLMPKVMESFNVLKKQADIIVVEGAGSPAEINLRSADIANMGFAEAASCPVVIVADIDRGGVIASLVGTHALISQAEKNRIKGYIINKFRGDASLFDGAIDIIHDHTAWSSLGVVPFFKDAGKLPAEDAMSLDGFSRGGKECLPKNGQIKIVVPRLPRIANFDDLDPLAAETGVAIELVACGRPLPADADVILLPGSKATLSDLDALRQEGWDIDILSHHRRGGVVIGLCGGYQMLGQKISDPDGVEGSPRTLPGLGILDVETVLGGDKTVILSSGQDVASKHNVSGYEIHMGTTTGPDTGHPWLMMTGNKPEGAKSKNNQVMGCYLHGLFQSDQFRQHFLQSLGMKTRVSVNYRQQVDTTLDELSHHLETHLNIDRLHEIAFTQG